MRVDPTKYVVLDVETNGLSSESDDLLSISIYRPDTQLMYNRFLPLELNTCVKTTSINGITEEMIKNCKALSQDEVDQVIVDFELKERIILTYGDLDRRFIKRYFKRHRLKGFDRLSFYNFKHDIISSRFSEGKEQLFYEAKGRNCYLLQTDWVFSPKRQLDINIYTIDFVPVERKPGGPSRELRKMDFTGRSSFGKTILRQVQNAVERVSFIQKELIDLQNKPKKPDKKKHLTEPPAACILC